MQYRGITRSGRVSQVADQTVAVHYGRGLIDGCKFACFHGRRQPANHVLDRVITEWVEVLQMTQDRDKRQLLIPPLTRYNQMPQTDPCKQDIDFRVGTLKAHQEAPGMRLDAAS